MSWFNHKEYYYLGSSPVVLNNPPFFADKKGSERWVPVLVFCCRLCTASLVHPLLPMLILPTITLPIPIPSCFCLPFMLVGSHPSHLPQHVQILLLGIPNSVYFSSSCAFLLPLFPLIPWVQVLVSLRVPHPVSILPTCSFFFFFLLQLFPQHSPAFILHAAPPLQFFIPCLPTISVCFHALLTLTLVQFHVESLCPGWKHTEWKYIWGNLGC